MLVDSENVDLDDVSIPFVAEMHDDPNLPPSLTEFLEGGIADEELGKRIIEECKGHEKYGFFSEAFAAANGYPVKLWDGVGDAIDLEEADDDGRPSSHSVSGSTSLHSKPPRTNSGQAVNMRGRRGPTRSRRPGVSGRRRKQP